MPSLPPRSTSPSLLVEQNLRFIQALAERVLIMQKGTIVATIAPEQLSDRAIVDEYLGI